MFIKLNLESSSLHPLPYYPITYILNHLPRHHYFDLFVEITAQVNLIHVFSLQKHVAVFLQKIIQLCVLLL